MSQVSEINAILDGLGEGASFDEVEYALRDYEHGMVLTVLADRSLAVGGGGGGGSLPHTFEQISGAAAVSVPGDDTPTALLWAHNYGDALLDYTDPAGPTIVTAGTYVLTAMFVTVDTTVPDEWATLHVDMDANGDDNNASDSMPLIVNLERSVTLAAYCPAGALLDATVTQGSGSPFDFQLRAVLQRIG